jgi:bidirectional [NiFe] hydrogenase diaphorase subunit
LPTSSRSSTARGAEWYASLGTEKSKGTKVFALTGKIRNNGLIEVPMGITIREIVEDLGGGTPDGTKIKAVQTGGPIGRLHPGGPCSTRPVDYDSLMKVGSIMGSGGMVVMDEDTNMVDVARNSTWSSAWRNRAASASRAAPARCRCTIC